MERRKQDSRNLLLCHLNVNSIQNKIDELSELMRSFQCQIMALSETKIDSTYPNKQFQMQGYKIFRKDRKAKGGGVMLYIAEELKPRKLGLPRKNYNKIEALAATMEVEGEMMVVLCIYRPPKAAGKDHYLRTEQELNEIVAWATLQSKILIITGDLNLNRLQPHGREGKMLIDLEHIHNLNCLITEPTRCTDSSQTLIDVILTNKPEYFEMSGQFDAGMSDHGLMCKKTKQYPSKIIKFRSKKDLDEEKLRPRGGNFYWYVTGGQTQYIFEKPKNILNLGNFRPQKYTHPKKKYTEIRTFVDPKNVLTASWYIKIKGFIAFSATALRYFGEKLSLALTFSNFLISNPKNIPIMLQIAYPKVY